MKKLNRCLSLVGLAAISVGAVSALASCNKKEEVVIWCAENAKETTEQLVDEFCETYPEFADLYKVRVEIQGEGDAATNVITDVSSAADIYFFAQDQLARLVNVGGLSAVPSSSVEDISTRNDASSVLAGTSGDVLYAYPATSDNGYFVFYDKSVEGLEAEMTRDGGPRQSELIKIAEENSKTIDFELTSSGWYLASYFIATGCESTWYTDESGAFVSYVDTWNSAAGVTAIEGASELIHSTAFRDNSDGSISFNGGAMLIVDGTWDTGVIENILGDDMGVAPLWTFSVEGDVYNSVEEGETETFHLGSFSGNKLVGVKPNTDGTKNGWTHVLANYLTGEHAQLLRFEELGWGPSNLAAQASEEVASDEVLAAFNAQNEYAVPQGQYPNDWWDITVSFGSKIASSDGSAAALVDLLADYQADIEGIIGKIQGDYVITGNLDGVSWSVGPAVGVSPYALYEGNADTGTYNVGSDGVVHGKWTVPVELVGGGCYVNSDGTAAAEGTTDENGVTTYPDGSIELGLVRVCYYDDWTGNWGYNELTSTTGYYNWNSEGFGGGTDNNIGALPGSYTFVFDYTGSTPTITMTAVA